VTKNGKTILLCKIYVQAVKEAGVTAMFSYIAYSRYFPVWEVVLNNPRPSMPPLPSAVL